MPTSDLAKAPNLLSIFCLLGSCRTQHNDPDSFVKAPLSDHSPSGLCELHICELRREEDDGARLTHVETRQVWIAEHALETTRGLSVRDLP